MLILKYYLLLLPVATGLRSNTKFNSNLFFECLCSFKGAELWENRRKFCNLKITQTTPTTKVQSQENKNQKFNFPKINSEIPSWEPKKKRNNLLSFYLFLSLSFSSLFFTLLFTSNKCKFGSIYLTPNQTIQRTFQHVRYFLGFFPHQHWSSRR